MVYIKNKFSERNLKMPEYVKSIKANGIYGRFDLVQEFHPGVNIIHGKNGTGKTTVLHILANILNGDYRRFAFLPFSSIEVNLDDDSTIRVEKLQAEEQPHIIVVVNDELADDFSIADAHETLGMPSERTTPPSEQRRMLERMLSSLRPMLSTAYFPAFRTLIEAASRNEESEIYYTTRPTRAASQQLTISSTRFSRRFFGNFVPWINYPSPLEVGYRLATEAQQAFNNVANIDRELLSKAFLDIFAALSSSSSDRSYEQPETVLESIKKLFEKLEGSALIADAMSDEEVYSKLRGLVLDFRFRKGLEHIYVPVLEVYQKALAERVKVQESSSKTIKLYLDSVNEFLERKKLVLRRRRSYAVPNLELQFEDNTFGNIQALSSGERQIVTLVYSATHMSEQKVVLIDEPEISLHIDWQIKLLPKMIAQLRGKQIITCTHSPTIAADYEDQMMELKLTPSSISKIPSVEVDDDPEEVL
jgi:predicted ATPase